MSNTQPSPVDEQSLLLYQVVAARRVGFDSMLWQAPGLGITAQAFLMTIALGPGSGQAARVASGVLSAVVSFISVQLLIKHRYHEMADSIWLQEFERSRGLPEVHAPGAARCAAAGITTGRFGGLRSHRVWILGLTSFGLVGLGAAVAGIIG